MILSRYHRLARPKFRSVKARLVTGKKTQSMVEDWDFVVITTFCKQLEEQNFPESKQVVP